jgi:hypothetical protein
LSWLLHHPSSLYPSPPSSPAIYPRLIHLCPHHPRSSRPHDRPQHSFHLYHHHGPHAAWLRPVPHPLSNRQQRHKAAAKLADFIQGDRQLSHRQRAADEHSRRAQSPSAFVCLCSLHHLFACNRCRNLRPPQPLADAPARCPLVCLALPPLFRPCARYPAFFQHHHLQGPSFSWQAPRMQKGARRSEIFPSSSTHCRCLPLFSTFSLYLLSHHASAFASQPRTSFAKLSSPLPPPLSHRPFFPLASLALDSPLCLWHSSRARARFPPFLHPQPTMPSRT